MIYVLRPAVAGLIVQFKLFANDQLIGITKGKCYFYYQADPGEINFELKAPENSSTLSLTVEAGKIYYLKQNVKLGIVAGRCELVEITEEEALTLLKKCNYCTYEEKSDE